MQTKSRKLLATLLVVALLFGLSAALPLTASAVNRNVTISGSDSVNDVRTKIQNQIAASSSGDTVTVGGASLDQVGSRLDLNIKAGVTVIWKIGYGCPASIDRLISITGEGTFEVAEGAYLAIADSGTVIEGGNGVDIIISGGMITAADGHAIDAFYVTMTGGKIVTHGAYCAINARAVEIFDGEVYAMGTGGAIFAMTVEVYDGEIMAYNSGTAIHGGAGVVRISGGRIMAQGNGDAVYSESGVEVSGGFLWSSGGRAIYAMTMDTEVTIEDGYVSNSGENDAVYARHISVGHGSVVEACGSGNAIFSAGKFSSVTINGGVVRAMSGRAIMCDDDNTVRLNSGFVFACGTDVSEFGDVIMLFGGAPILNGGIICAWKNPDPQPPYVEGSSTDLKIKPATATAKWSIHDSGSGYDNGILYKNGINEGYCWVEFVNVIKSPTGTGSMGNFGKPKTYTPGMFTDVNENMWYGFNQQKTVADAYEYGMMSGTSATTFNPTGNMTIAEAITVATRVHSIYHTGKQLEFTPVPGDPWYMGNVRYAIDKDIIKSDDFSNYNVPATRGEVAYIFARTLPVSEYQPRKNTAWPPDVPNAMRYSVEIHRLYIAGIVGGSDALGTFYPLNNITRAEAAAILARLIVPARRFGNL